MGLIIYIMFEGLWCRVVSTGHMLHHLVDACRCNGIQKPHPKFFSSVSVCMCQLQSCLTGHFFYNLEADIRNFMSIKMDWNRDQCSYIIFLIFLPVLPTYCDLQYLHVIRYITLLISQVIYLFKKSWLGSESERWLHLSCDMYWSYLR